MYEVEVKVEAAHDAVRPVLHELGADALGNVRQVDTYYDAPHRDFAATDEALRLRRERGPDGGDPSTVLTYKGPLVEAASKTREEVESAVDDGDATEAILSGLGFDPAATVAKDRERFDLEGFVITLDAVDGLGEFVEVETDVDREADVERAREGAVDVLRALDLDPDEGIRTSYLGLLLDAPNGAADDCE